MKIEHLPIVRLFNTFEPVTTFYCDLFSHWTGQGWQIEAVMSHAEYRSGREHSWSGKNTQIRWIPGAGLEATTRLNKFLIMLLYILGATVVTLFDHSVDRNVFLTQPPLFYLWGRILQLVRRQPYFIVLMDMHPELAIQAGLLAPRALSAQILRRLSHYGLRRADGVIVIGRCMQERVIQAGVAAERVHLIPNWIDQENVKSVSHDANTFRLRMGWQDKFVVLYSGNIGTPHFFDDILEVSRRLRRCPDLLFAFIGHGQRRHEIETYKAEYALENIQLLPFQPLEQLAQSLSAGDLHFVSLKPRFEGLVVPSKAYGTLAVGRPILYQGGERGEIARMILEEDVGTVVAPGDPDSLEDKILSYLRNPATAVEQGQRARQLSETTYSKQAACRRYTEVIAGL